MPRPVPRNGHYDLPPILPQAGLEANKTEKYPMQNNLFPPLPKPTPINQPNASVSDDWLTQYACGFKDAYLNQAYHEGLAHHKFQVCVPTDDPYRLGFLRGLAARN
jgi:hypothetical protein